MAAARADVDAGQTTVRDRVTVQEIPAAIATALEPLAQVVPELNVYGYRNPNPTPPAIDIYPAPAFQVGAGFGTNDKRVAWIIRARVAQTDPEAAQRTLLRLLDPTDPASVEAALYASSDDFAIGNDDQVIGLTDDPDGLASCTWQVSVFLS
jgi:hypothetical protein